MKSKLDIIIIALLVSICVLLILITWTLNGKKLPKHSDPENVISKMAQKQTAKDAPPQQTTNSKPRSYYFDSTSGSNYFSGTSASTAWRDILKLKQEKIVPGTRILLKRGSRWRVPLHIRGGGTTQQPVIVEAYGRGDIPLIDLGNQFPTGLMVYHSNIRVSNLRIENSKKNGVSVAQTGGIRNILLSNLMIYNAGLNGIGVSLGGNNIRIRNCYIENSKNNGIALLGSKENKLGNVVISDCHIKKTGSNDGITVHLAKRALTPGSNFLIENTTAELCNEQGFDITAGKNILLLNNRSRQNNAGGVVVGGVAENVTIRHHISIDEPTEKKSAAININSKAKNVRLIQSLIKGNGYHLLRINASDVAVYNNTFVWNGGSSPWDLSGKTENIYLFNNILYSKQNKMSRIRFLEKDRPPDHKSFYLDHNLYYIAGKAVAFYHNNKNYTFETYQKKFNIESASKSKNPEFIAPLIDNYQLKKTSPAINSGRFLGKLTQGKKSNQLRVENALFFYKGPTPQTRQQIWLTKEEKLLSVLDIDYIHQIITVNKPVAPTGQESLSIFANESRQDLGAYGYGDRLESGQ